MSGPARGYTWPPFQPGNQVTRTHGVTTATRAEEVAAEVAEMAEAVSLTFPWTRPYFDERRAYVRALIDERDVVAYLDKVGTLDENGNERSAVRTAERFARRAACCRTALGLTPMAHARLLALLSAVVHGHPEIDGHDDALDSLMREGRAALARASERPALPGGHLSTEDDAARRRSQLSGLSMERGERS